MNRVKKCVTCGGIALTISDAEYNQHGTAYRRFNATKYCCECADFWYRNSKRNADRSYHERRKLINRQLVKRISLLQDYADNLIEQNRKLKYEIENFQR